MSTPVAAMEGKLEYKREQFDAHALTFSSPTVHWQLMEDVQAHSSPRVFTQEILMHTTLIHLVLSLGTHTCALQSPIIT